MNKRNFLRSLGLASVAFLSSGAFAIGRTRLKNNFNYIGDIDYHFKPTMPVDGKFSLPLLGYDYNALEPNIDAQTMEIHYSRHHQGYVNNLNAAISGKPESSYSLEKICAMASNKDMAVRNNAGGHYNHSFFWKLLTPGGSNKPTGDLASAIERDFGSFDAFREKFTDAATKRFGSGWAWLVKGANNKLYVYSSPNQDNPLMTSLGYKGIPIIGIDVWEHAYYLKYQNKRGDYIKNFWNIVNWDVANKNYSEK
ncbi:MAG: Superoxide dismutase [Candidatus Parvibacillus calidus]|nr:MAG: Superoxide dismutase [Candidatus Parvibacillus calidus]